MPREEPVQGQREEQQPSVLSRQLPEAKAKVCEQEGQPQGQARVRSLLFSAVGANGAFHPRGVIQKAHPGSSERHLRKGPGKKWKSRAVRGKGVSSRDSKSF